MRTTIDSYKARAGRLETSDIDFSAFVTDPLPPEALRCIRYMHHIEHHTICYLRDLLLTSAHRDPDITAFLACWVFEELWHGEALAEVLRAHGEAGGTPAVAALRRDRRLKDARETALHLAAAKLVGPAFVAVHMTWGAVNEWTTQAGYAQLSRRAGHPVLSELLKRIMRQEGRHIDFYASEATRRLDGHRGAQRLTRAALRRLWRPVGSGVMPTSEVSFLVQYLFGDDDGRAVARRVDRRIDALPGLGGLGLILGSIEQLDSVAPAPARAAQRSKQSSRDTARPPSRCCGRWRAE